MQPAIAITHVPFEDAGLLAPRLGARGISVETRPAWEMPAAAAEAPLVILLGGPISANDTAAYPFLTAEIALAERRMADGLPTLGICLGAQIMARAAGGTVGPGARPEIGRAPVELTAAGRESVLAPLAGVAVLHAQGDPRRHGGPDKAVRAYPTAHYALWVAQLPQAAGRFRLGTAGKNLVVEGAREAYLPERPLTDWRRPSGGQPGAAAVLEAQPALRRAGHRAVRTAERADGLVFPRAGRGPRRRRRHRVLNAGPTPTGRWSGSPACSTATRRVEDWRPGSPRRARSRRIDTHTQVTGTADCCFGPEPACRRSPDHTPAS